MYTQLDEKTLKLAVENAITEKFYCMEDKVPEDIWNSRDGWKKLVKGVCLNCYSDCHSSQGLEYEDARFSGKHETKLGFFLAFYLNSRSLVELLKKLPEAKVIPALQVACFLLNEKNAQYLNYACYSQNPNRKNSLSEYLQREFKTANPCMRNMIKWCQKLLTSTQQPETWDLVDLSADDVGVDKINFQRRKPHQPPPTCFIPPGDYTKKEVRLCSFLPLGCGNKCQNPCAIAMKGFYYTGNKNKIRCSCCLMEHNYDTLNHDEYYHESSCCFIMLDLCTCEQKHQFADLNSNQMNSKLLQSRIKSFLTASWSIESSLAYASAGFFFSENNVKCCLCNGSLADWQSEENPWKNHVCRPPGPSCRWRVAGIAVRFALHSSRTKSIGSCMQLLQVPSQRQRLRSW